MTSMNPYLSFAGNCREALDFYKPIFGGEVSGMQTYGESGFPGTDATPNAIMHSEFKAEGVYFMASDDTRGFKVHPENNISLSLQFTDVAEQTRVFNALAHGGSVTVPLDVAPWGASFGMLTDKYGIQWLLNCYVK